jgi:hypothetical protein
MPGQVFWYVQRHSQRRIMRHQRSNDANELSAVHAGSEVCQAPTAAVGMSRHCRVTAFLAADLRAHPSITHLRAAHHCVAAGGHLAVTHTAASSWSRTQQLSAGHYASGFDAVEILAPLLVWAVRHSSTLLLLGAKSPSD